MTSWLLTFLVHSTLWCGFAWLGLRLYPGAPARLRETIWYTALAASLITPTVHSLTSPDSAVWRLPVPSFIAVGEHESGEESGHRDEVASASVSAGEEAHGKEHATNESQSASAAVLWILLAGGSLAFYLLRLGRLRGRLRDREPVMDPGAARALTALAGRAALAPAPRLTESHDLGSPVALGVGARREICVPARALHELDERELRALLGHEVAHHLRRDTIRLAALNVLQALFFFQPFLRLGVRELRLAAEELCDDWAASQFDDRLAMASCLAEVAGWMVPRDRRIPVPCIGRRRSQLERRVWRLMNEHRSLRSPSGPWRHAGALTLLILAPLIAPALAPGTDGSHEDRPLRDGTRPREHGLAREHELGERRERARARPAPGSPPAGEGDLNKADASFPAHRRPRGDVGKGEETDVGVWPPQQDQENTHDKPPSLPSAPRPWLSRWRSPPAPTTASLNRASSGTVDLDAHDPPRSGAPSNTHKGELP